MRIIGYTYVEPDLTVVEIEAWYDRMTTSWVIQSKNAAGYQVGDATYVGHKIDAVHDVRVRRKAHPMAHIVTPRSLGKI